METTGPELYPLTFVPRLKERIWGGTKLGELFRKPLPASTPIGESWEVSDRPGDVSVIANGSLAGKDLHCLIQNHAMELMGDSGTAPDRFPLLIKILDAREKLSLQVHPPLSIASSLGGEPKTELWYIAEADPGAELFVGLKRGIRAKDFEEKLRLGSVAECFHRIPVKAADAMFLPSGRVHAIGGGLVIFEIQQNSDTTYRVFDWNRTGLDGKPRDLHIPESLQSINFQDFEPDLVPVTWKGNGNNRTRLLADDPLFSVSQNNLTAGETDIRPSGKCQIVGILKGCIGCESPGNQLKLEAGQFCLIPASVTNCILRAIGDVSYLDISPGNAA